MNDVPDSLIFTADGRFEIVPEGIDLGDSVDVLILARRTQEITTDEPVLIYNIETAEFSTRTESQPRTISVPSFLVLERTTGRFVEFCCDSKALRAEAKKIYPFLPLTQRDVADREIDVAPHGPSSATLTARRKNDGSFYPAVSRCDMPFDNLPSRTSLAAEIEWFKS